MGAYQPQRVQHSAIVLREASVEERMGQVSSRSRSPRRLPLPLMVERGSGSRLASRAVSH